MCKNPVVVILSSLPVILKEVKNLTQSVILNEVKDLGSSFALLRTGFG
jgi:hypothetical protein